MIFQTQLPVLLHQDDWQKKRPDPLVSPMLETMALGTGLDDSQEFRVSSLNSLPRASDRTKRHSGRPRLLLSKAQKQTRAAAELLRFSARLLRVMPWPLRLFAPPIHQGPHK